MSTADTCRDCALPWADAPCGNCGCGEPAAIVAAPAVGDGPPLVPDRAVEHARHAEPAVPAPAAARTRRRSTARTPD